MATCGVSPETAWLLEQYVWKMVGPCVYHCVVSIKECSFRPCQQGEAILKMQQAPEVRCRKNCFHLSDGPGYLGV